MANEVKLDIIINTLTDEKTKAKAEKQGKDFVEAYQKVIDSANKFKNNTDYTNDSSLTKDLAKQIEGLSQIGNKAFKKQIDTWLKQINSYIKQAESQISVFDMPSTPTKPPKPPKDNKNTDIDFNGLGKGLENAEKMMAVFLEKFQKFCADLQKEANKPIKLNGLKAGITEAQKAVNDTVKSFKTSFTVPIKPVVSVTEAKASIDKIKNSIKPIDIDVKFSNIKVPQIDSAMESIEKAAKRKIKFDGINEGVNSAKAKMQELVNDFKTKTSMLPPLAKMKVSFDGFDLSIKDKISKSIQSASKSFDDFAKKAEAMPKALDGAVNAMATSIIKLEAGINGLVTVVASAVTRITDEVKKLPKSFDDFQNTIKVTGRMLRDLGKNTGKGIKGQLSSISSDLKKFETTLNSLGSALPSKLVSALNQIASAVSRMEALVIRLNNTFKNLDVKSFDNIKVKAQEIEAVFRTLNTAGNDLGKNTGKPMYSALTGLQKKIRGLIQLLREAQKEARNLGTSFGGTYTADISALNSALAGLQSRLEAISRIQLPNIPRVPNIPSNSGGNNGSSLGNLLGGSMPNLSLPAMNGLNNVASGVTGALQNFQSRVSNAAKAMGRLPEEINNLIVKFNVIYYGLPNIANTLTAPFASGFEFQADVETSQLGLSGILTQMTTLNGEVMTFDKAMEVSEGVFERLNQQAILTAASTKDLITTFQGLAAPAFGQGFNLEQLEDFTVKGVNVAKAFRLNSTQFIQELRDLLNGGIQAASSTIATSFGITDAKLKEWRNSEEGLFVHLMDVFEGFGPAMEKFPATLTGMKDQITEFGQLASREFTLAFENDIKYVMSIIQNLFGTIKKNADGVKYFEPNPLIKDFFDTVGQSVRQLGLLWSEFISAIGSFDNEGVFNVTPKGMELWDTFKATLSQIWGVILLINESIAAASPIWVDIAIGLQQVLQFGLQVVASALAPMVEYTKYVADNWETVKEKIIEFATEVYNSSTVLNTIVAGVKVIAGAVVGLAQGVGYVIDNWDAMKPVIVEITTDIIAIWGALKIMNALVVGAKIFVTALEAAYLAVRTAVVLVMGAVRALAALEAMLTLIQRVGDLATAWRFVRLMIFRAYGATKALALADFIVNTIRNVNNLSSAWMAVTIILKEVIRLTKATAIWSAVSSVVSGIGKLFAANPALGLVGAGAAIGGIGAIGALINKVFDEVTGAFDSVSGMTDNFAKEAEKDMQDLMQAFNNLKPPEDKEKDTKPNIDPKAVESSIKREPDKKALEKAEKERLKLAKKALKEMLSSLDAHLKEQLSILKDSLEQLDLMKEQNQVGWQDYNEGKINNLLSQDKANLSTLEAKINAIRNSDSFDNEDDRQNQLNPLLEKYDEAKRSYDKHLLALEEIRDLLSLDLTQRQLSNSANSIGTQTTMTMETPVDSFDSLETWLMHYFVEIGKLPKEIAAVIVGNMYAESSLNPTTKVVDSNGKWSYGLAQWNGGRYDALREYASSKGYDESDPRIQAEFLLHEFQTSEKYFWDKFLNAIQGMNGNIREMSRAYAHNIERPAAEYEDIEARWGNAIRLNNEYQETARINYSGAGSLAVKAGEKMMNDGWKYGTYDTSNKTLQCARFVVKSWDDSYGIINKLSEKLGLNLDTDLVSQIVDVARALGALHSANGDYTPKAGDAIIVGADEHHAIMATGNDKQYIHSPSWGRSIEYGGNYDYDSKYYVELEKILEKAGVTAQDVTNAMNNRVYKTAEGLAADRARKEADQEALSVSKELYEIWGKAAELKEKELYNEYYGTSGKISKLKANKKDEAVGDAENLYQIKLNRNRFGQSTEYLSRALAIIEDNASTMMYKIGNGFLQGASNIKEMTTKYLDYMVKGGNYPFGEFDLSKILSDFEKQAREAWKFGDTSTYIEIKSKIKSIKDSLMGIIDNFQSQVKDAASWMNDMINESDMTDIQKEVASRNVNAKMYEDLALSERQKALQLIESNERNILEYKEKINALDKESATYESDMLNYQQEITRLQNDPTVQQYWRNAELYMKKASNEARNMKNTFREIGIAAKQALEDGLVTFLTDGINECETLADALNDLVVSILKVLQKKFAENLVGYMMDAWFPQNQNEVMGTPVPSEANAGTTTPDLANSNIDTSMANASLEQLGQSAQNASASFEQIGQSAQNVSTAIEQPTATVQNVNGEVQNEAVQISNVTASLAALGETINIVSASFTNLSTEIGNLIARLSSISIGPTDGYATGGYISGPGTGTSDSILTRLSNGEFVIKAASVRKYGASMLERINNGTFSNMRVAIPAFAGGGLVGDAGSAVASKFSSEFAGSLKSDIHITNFVDGKRAIDTDAIKTIVREVNRKDAKINSIMSKRVR